MKIKLETKKWIHKSSSLLYGAKAININRYGLFKKQQRKKIKKKSHINRCITQAKFNCNVFKLKNIFFSSALSSKPEAIIESQLILCHVLKISKVELHCHDHFFITSAENALLNNYVNRRLQGEPLAYILGTKEFYGLDFKVNSHTLIPRPETELLVDEVLNFQNKNNSKLILDLGCGSGCIGLAILHNISNAKVLFVDISEKTLEVARENAKKLGLEEQCLFYCGDFTLVNFINELLNFLNDEIGYGARTFDIIVSNPPYIPVYEYKKLHQSVKEFEPKQALVSDSFEQKSGAYHLNKVISLTEKLLTPKGLFLMEHGYNQAETAIKLCNQNIWEKLETKKDYAGLQRYLRGILWKNEKI